MIVITVLCDVFMAVADISSLFPFAPGATHCRPVRGASLPSRASKIEASNAPPVTGTPVNIDKLSRPDFCP